MLAKPIPHGICVSLAAADSLHGAKTQQHLESCADMVELRLDTLDPGESPETWVSGWRVPILVSCRRAEQGGGFEGSEEERLRLLQRAVSAGARYVDLEADVTEFLQTDGWQPRPGFLLSLHHDEGAFHLPLSELYRDLVGRGADAVKLIPTAHSCTESLDFLDELSALTFSLDPQDPPLTAFCMGQYGALTRILALHAGSRLVFASSEPGKELAPGQIPAEVLHHVYRVHEMGSATLFTGILGARALGSYSPLMHNAAYQCLDLDYRYLPFSVRPDEIGPFLNRLKTGDMPIPVRGLSVTTPYKLNVLPVMDELAGCALRIGAVNTMVKRRSGLWRGYNTDRFGAVKTLRHATGGKLEGMKALLIGAGGAARAVAFGLVAEGVILSIANRTPGRARELAHEAGCEGGEMAGYAGEHFDMVINATTIGSRNEAGPLPTIPALEPGSILFDLNYSTRLSPLLEAGRNFACKVVNGVEMLIHQGERQFRLFTGRKPPAGIMRAAILHQQRDTVYPQACFGEETT